MFNRSKDAINRRLYKRLILVETAIYRVSWLNRTVLGDILDEKIAKTKIMITLFQSPLNSDPEVMGGTLVFRNTRVPAQSLLEYLDDGFSLDEFLDNFPSVNRVDAVNFLRLAREQVQYENHSG